MENKESVIKEQRNNLLHVRVKVSVYKLLMDMIKRRQKTTDKHVSQADIIEDALKYADGQIVDFASKKIEVSKKNLGKGAELIESSKQLIIDHNKTT